MAGYADSLLADGEHIELRTRQHPLAIFLSSRFFWLFAVGAALFFLLGRVVNNIPALDWVALVCLLLALIWLSWRYLGWTRQEYVVTNRRVIKAEGIISKQSGDSSLEKINDAVLREGLLGRLLGFGDLEILTAAESSVDTFEMLRRPKDFKKAMLNAKYALERDIATPMPSAPLRAVNPAPAPAAAPPAPVAPVPSETVAAPPAEPSAVADKALERSPMTADEVTETLHRLADLRDRGAISANDFEAKKAELLGRL